jgi:2-phosphosulfolactate phosphatase
MPKNKDNPEMKQSLFDIRCEWGEHGILKLRDECDVLVVVDVLSFSSCISIAVNRGAVVYPFQFDQAKALEFAKKQGARCAVKRDQAVNSDELTLSPSSFLNVTAGTAIVLPSPNGAVLCQMGGQTPVLAGSLRNARAVAASAMHLGAKIGVVPAGERWEDNSLRPAWEDLIGAGAIINELDGPRSPEAAVAEMAYLSVTGELEERMSTTVSGRELIERGYASDVHLACAENVDAFSARLIDDAFVQY